MKMTIPNYKKTTMIKAVILSFMLLLSNSNQNVIAQIDSKRCQAITKKGTRCKNQTVSNTKYCKVHQAKSPSVKRCKAKTKSGLQCSREAKTSGYCKQHYKIFIEGKL